jgi:hypothetical protein
MQTRPTTHHCCSTMTTRNGQTRRARCIRRPRLAPRGSAASRPTHSLRCPRPAARTATRSSSKRARNGRLSCFTHEPHPPLRPAQVCPYPRSRQPTRPDHHAGAPLISCNGQPHASAVSAVLLTTPNRRTHTRSDQAQVCPYHSPHQFTRPDRHVGALPIPPARTGRCTASTLAQCRLDPQAQPDASPALTQPGVSIHPNKPVCPTLARASPPGLDQRASGPRYPLPVDRLGRHEGHLSGQPRAPAVWKRSLAHLSKP